MGKLSALPQDSTPSTDDYTVTVDTGSGQTKKILLSDLITLIYNNKPAVNIQRTTLSPANFSTNSTSYVDYTGLSVSITTSSNTSGVVLIILSSGWFDVTIASNLAYLALCDSSNNELKSVIKGGIGTGNYGVPTTIVHAVTGLSPNTTYTYKARVKASSGTLTAGTGVVTGDSITALEL